MWAYYPNLYTVHKKGQLTDDEFFSNESGSPEFENFLNLLGGKICLKGKVTLMQIGLWWVDHSFATHNQYNSCICTKKCCWMSYSSNSQFFAIFNFVWILKYNLMKRHITLVGTPSEKLRVEIFRIIKLP